MLIGLIRVLALTYSLLDIFFYSNLQFPVNVIINKAKGKIKEKQ
jgi:hypothetical protein